MKTLKKADELKHLKELKTEENSHELTHLIRLREFELGGELHDSNWKNKQEMVRVVFLHPDLGIGGAERLVVDAAMSLKGRGHQVSFLTNHHDSSHCFKETSDGSFPVQVVGDWIPRQIFGRFHALFAYIRILYAAIYASYCLSRKEKIDLIICDLISVGIPLLRVGKSRPKIIYYCHFPDQLLSTPGGFWKDIYRAPINFFEKYTIGLADKILVNSKFTLRVFHETFERLDRSPEVLYPSVNTKYFDEMSSRCAGSQQSCEAEILSNIPENAFIFLDINRYERKKNHALGIRAFHSLMEKLKKSESKNCHLVIAGGYDTRVPENVEHYKELENLVNEMALQKQITLLRSPKDDEKFDLLKAAKCLLYTPENEHFGIVPLEAMYMSKPVIAVNSGGPMETIVNNSTGFLCRSHEDDFSSAMLQVFRDDVLRDRMGHLGRKRVEQMFSFEAFGEKLEAIIHDTISAKNNISSSKMD